MKKLGQGTSQRQSGSRTFLSDVYIFSLDIELGFKLRLQQTIKQRKW